MTDEQILADILRREGGFVNHPADPGKATNFGITQATLSEWRRAPASVEDVRALTSDEACAIYRARYLAPFVDAEPAVRAQLVDIAVNSGVGRARQLLARAEQNRRERSLQLQLVIERLKFYAGLVKHRPQSAVFLPGWINRATEFL